MPRVRIVTDSAATLDPAVVKQLEIAVLPLTVRIDGKDYHDGIDLSAEELLLDMARQHLRPTIVGPTAAQFQELYGQLTRTTNQIISLHSAAGLSAIVREAQAAAREYLGRCDIVVMDSQTVSLGLGILVEEAARMAQDNVPLGEIVRQIRGIIRHIYIVMITDELDYLEHSRLISPSQAILGTMLNIKPFLAIEEGALIPMEKVRSRERAIEKIAEFASEFSEIKQMAILQSTPYPTDETKLLLERLALVAPNKEAPILLYGPLLAAHVGPNAMGLVVLEGTGKETMY
jgi:DegV family protein with EDD domain